MKKIYSTLILAFLTANAAKASDIFNETFGTPEAFDAWTVHDANDDERTWKYDQTDDLKVFYNYHSTNQADDWLFSPAFTVPEQGSYLISFNTKGSSYGEDLELWTGSAANVAAMATKAAEYKNLPLAVQTQSVLTEFAAGQQVVLGFHAVTPADHYRLYVNNISVRKVDNPADLAVSAIISPVTGEDLGAENVKVLIENKGNTPVDAFGLNYTITVNGNTTADVTETVTPPAPLAPGTSMEYTFTAKADLSTPRTAYALTVSIILPDDINVSNNSASAEIRHVSAATVPYFMGFEKDEDTSNLSFLNLNNDDGDWSITVNSWFTYVSRTGDAALCYNYNSANAADDWAFLDPFALTAGHYALKFWYSATENHPERLRVCYGTAPTPEAMTNVLAEYNPMTNINYKESITIFEIPADGKYYIGFYAFSDANENWLLIDDVSLEAVDPDASDLEITSLDKPYSYWREGHSTGATVGVRNIGIKDVDTDIVVYVDGNEIKRTRQTIAAQQARTVEVADVMDNLTAGTHTVKVVLDYPDDTKPANNTVERSVTVLGQAVALWDFESCPNEGTPSQPHYALPSDLTYRAEDSNTVHPDAGSEFEENGFGIFSIQKHDILGERMLAACSWFTSPGTADRWLVLPQIEVTGENAWFAWDANSYNPDHLEDYRVKVSDGEDRWSSYTTEASVDKESVSSKTRGISLAKYAGKQVYVAINLVSYNCEALLLDNLGLYGDVKRVSTGIESVGTDSGNSIDIDGDILTVTGSGVTSVAVYDLTGMRLAAAEGNTLSIAALDKGNYIVRAATGEGTATLKFRR